MTTAEERADLIVLAVSIYSDRNFLSLNHEAQDRAVARLGAYGILSTPAISAITGVSPYRIRRVTRPLGFPDSRGKLNPNHLTQLGYMNSWGKVKSDDMLKRLVSGGTSISTIADLTGIGESTLRRKLR